MVKSIQIPKNHLMIIADGVLVHHNISTIVMIPVMANGTKKN